jgi:hypothetical protein
MTQARSALLVATQPAPNPYDRRQDPRDQRGQRHVATALADPQVAELDLGSIHAVEPIGLQLYGVENVTLQVF